MSKGRELTEFRRVSPATYWYDNNASNRWYKPLEPCPRDVVQRYIIDYVCVHPEMCDWQSVCVCLKLCVFNVHSSHCSSSWFSMCV